MEPTPSFVLLKWSAIPEIRSGVLAVEEIKTIIHLAEAKNLRISFCWVPGHVGIVVNGKADTVAKEAAVNENDSMLGKAIHEKANRRSYNKGMAQQKVFSRLKRWKTMEM